MLSRTSGYALRAVLLLSRGADRRPQAAESVAAALGVPGNYLSKVLNRLARSGVLESVRGPGGGFRLARPPGQIPVSDIVALFDEQSPMSGCVMSEHACDEHSPCAAHVSWGRWSDAMRRLLEGTTIADLAQPPGRERDGNGWRPGVNDGTNRENGI